MQNKYHEFMKERNKTMMNDEHIVARYLMAKPSDRKTRIIELADENHCNVKTIKDILLANGVTEDELPKRGRPKTIKEESHKKEKIKLPEPEKVEVPLVQVEIKEPPIVDKEIEDWLPKEEPKLEKIPITVLNVAADTPSPISQMIAGLNTDTQKLKDEIERKQKILAATEKAYVALKELETVTNGEH